MDKMSNLSLKASVAAVCCAVGLVAGGTVLWRKQQRPPQKSSTVQIQAADTEYKTATVTYFQGRGRAEAMRWMLAAAGIPFVNVGLSSHAEFLALKEEEQLLFNQLPLLEIHGVRLTQSRACVRYIARHAGLLGNTLLEEAQINMILDCVSDLAGKIMNRAFVQDKPVIETEMHEVYAKYGPRLELILSKNGGQFLVGDKLSAADIVLCECLESYYELDRPRAYMQSTTPLLYQLHSRITQSPTIRQYLDSPQRFPVPDTKYAMNVKTVLNSPIPAWMYLEPRQSNNSTGIIATSTDSSTLLEQKNTLTEPARVSSLVQELNLQAHPEGGYYLETYRSTLTLDQQTLGKNFEGERALMTSIYFLLTKDNFSAFHRIQQDELWYYHGGDSLIVHVISPTGQYTAHQVGLNTAAKDTPQLLVPKNSWFASSVKPGGQYAFVGCTVAPGFDFKDFELAERETLCSEYPEHREIITKLTRL